MTTKKSQTFYIGLSSTFHDPAFSIINSQGEVVFAEAAERYLQNKRAITYAPADMVRLPRLIKEYCGDADLVIASSWPTAVGNKLSRTAKLLKMISSFMPNNKVLTGNDGLAWPMGSVTSGLERLSHSIANASHNISESPYLENHMTTRTYDHHLSHAATACYSSPFKEAACAIIDGFGGKGSVSFYKYSNGRFESVGSQGKWTDGSLGQFYSILCGLCGFDSIVGEEWKVMGMAPYGKMNTELYNEFTKYLAIKDMRIISKLKSKEYLKWLSAVKIRCLELCKTAEGAADLAATGQAFYVDLASELLNQFHRTGVSDNLVLSGGCALNSTFNGQILEKTPFKHLHVPSAPGDDGCGVGAALLAYYEDHPNEVKVSKVESPYLGSSISKRTLGYCAQFGNPEKVKHCPGTIVQEAAAILAKGGIIGWMQGRAEFGPRSLGHRSILADPRSLEMKDAINARVKFREAFRPFAPSIMHEFGDEYFYNYQETPYMERTLLFKEAVRAKIPAVVHENGSGRLQSVRQEMSPKFYDLIKTFHGLTGVPLLLNTSFNIMGKPIIHSVEDALGVFHTSGLDALIIDDYLFLK